MHEDIDVRTHDVVEKGMVESGLTTDPACAAPEDGGDSGEQPEEQPNRLVMEIGRRDPTNSRRGRCEGIGKECRSKKDEAVQLEHSSHRPTLAWH